MFSIVTDMLGKESFDDALNTAKELGFEYVDIRGKLDGDTVDSISLEKAAELMTKVQNKKLKISTLSSWAINPCTFSGPPKYDNYDESHHKNMERELDRLLDLAEVFHAKFIRVYPLHRPEGFDSWNEEMKENEYRHNAHVLCQHADHAKKRGVTLLVENEPPTLANTTKELAKIMKYADHSHLKVNWDIINGWRAGEYPALEQYENIKGNVSQVHLKGASRLVNSITKNHPYGQFNNFAIAGKDDFDHEELMKALIKHDPQVILAIDTHYPSFYQQDKIGESEVVRQTKEYFESVLALTYKE